MELPKAFEIMKLLADGKHPVSKERLDGNHVINEPDVIRALNKIIEALSSIEEKIKKQRDLPERVGKPWSKNEDQALIKPAAFEASLMTNMQTGAHSFPTVVCAKPLSRRSPAHWTLGGLR